jgi:hypothetical protein
MSPRILNLSTSSGVCSDLHTPDDVPTGKEPPVPIRLDARGGGGGITGGDTG